MGARGEVTAKRRRGAGPDGGDDEHFDDEDGDEAR